jgi:cytochrome b
MARGQPLWDAPVRIFHWALALLVVTSFVTGRLGGSWMEWHVKSGYGILTLLLFRLAWGFVGSSTARFSSFLKGPGVALGYARALFARRHQPAIGHNPLGGWMVLAMIAILLLQAATGLFADDEVATQGPLSILASANLVSRANRIHEWNQWVVVGATVLHLAAIAFYQWGLKSNLLGPMFHGGELPEPATRSASPVLASALFVVACVAVYCIVVLLPRLA